jgi:hypothetical protein
MSEGTDPALACVIAAARDRLTVRIGDAVSSELAARESEGHRDSILHSATISAVSICLGWAVLGLHPELQPSTTLRLMETAFGLVRADVLARLDTEQAPAGVTVQ